MNPMAVSRLRAVSFIGAPRNASRSPRKSTPESRAGRGIGAIAPGLRLSIMHLSK